MRTHRPLDSEGLGRVGHALADPTRRRILVALLDGARYPSELVGSLGLTKANVSNHLACLRGCGLVKPTPEGRRVRYELADHRLGDALTQLANLSLPPATGCEHERGAA